MATFTLVADFRHLVGEIGWLLWGVVPEHDGLGNVTLVIFFIGNRGLSTRSPLDARSALWARSWRVSTTILSVSNTQVGIVSLVLDSINGLDSIRDVRVVDECTVP